MREGGWVRLAGNPDKKGYVLSIDQTYAHVLWNGGQADIHDIDDLTSDVGPRSVTASLYDSLEYGTVDESTGEGMFEARKEAMSDVLPLLLDRLARDATVRASLARVDEEARPDILRGIAKRALQEHLEEDEE